MIQPSASQPSSTIVMKTLGQSLLLAYMQNDAATTLQTFVRAALAHRELDNSRRHGIDPNLIKCIHPYLNGAPLNPLRTPLDGRSYKRIHILDEHKLLIRRFANAPSNDSTEKSSTDSFFENYEDQDLGLMEKLKNNRIVRDLIEEKGFKYLRVARQTLIRAEDRVNLIESSDTEDANQVSSLDESSTSAEEEELVSIGSEGIVVEQLLPPYKFSREAITAFYVKNFAALDKAIIEFTQLLTIADIGDLLGHQLFPLNYLWTYGAPRYDNVMLGIDESGDYVISLPDLETNSRKEQDESLFDVAAILISFFPYNYDSIISTLNNIPNGKAFTEKEIEELSICWKMAKIALYETSIRHLDFIQSCEQNQSDPMLDFLKTQASQEAVKELLGEEMKIVHASGPSYNYYIRSPNLDLVNNLKIKTSKYQEAITSTYLLGANNLLNPSAESILAYYKDEIFSKQLLSLCKPIKKKLKELKADPDLNNIENINERIIILCEKKFTTTFILNHENPKTSYEFSVSAIENQKKMSRNDAKLLKPVHPAITESIVKRGLDCGVTGFKITTLILEIFKDQDLIANFLVEDNTIKVYI